MKIAETKIYIRFILWFIGVAFLSILSLFAVIYLFTPNFFDLLVAGLWRGIVIGVFVALAIALLLSLLATKYLAHVVSDPVHRAIGKLFKVAETLAKSVQNLSDISQNNSEVSQFLMVSSQEQRKGLTKGKRAVSGMVNSLQAISQKTQVIVKDISTLDNLATGSGKQKVTSALGNLKAVNNLVSEHQKLSHALDDYSQQVKDIVIQVKNMAESTELISANLIIELHSDKKSDKKLSNLISQMRDVSDTSATTADLISKVATDMQRQLKQSKDEAIFGQEDTKKSINTITQAVNFLTKIIGSVSNITQSIQVVNQETTETQEDADNILLMINNLGKEAQNLIKHTDDIAVIINKQLVVNRALNRSSGELGDVTRSLNNLIGQDNKK
jgi:methyl-accepting chemotaxis protein